MLKLILIIVGVLILAGIGYYLTRSDSEESGPIGDNPVVPPVEDQPEGPEDDDGVKIDEPIEDQRDPISEAPEGPTLVDELDVPQRVITALKNQNIRVVAELENLDGDFTDIKGIGEAYAEDIRQALREE